MKLRVFVLAFGILLAAAGTSAAAIIDFKAVLAGANENPPNASPATGLALMSYNDVTHTLSFNVSFSGLGANTVDAHIHCCTIPPANVGVAVGFVASGFPLGVTSGTYSNVFNLTNAAIYNAPFLTANGGTAAGAEAALIAGMLLGRAYVNIHTSTFPGGEIRGFSTVVPEPGTLSLLGMGAAFLAARARRRPRSTR